MNTYFPLLDWSSLFELLVRLHYEDLINLCKVRNYLYRITCTPHFQAEWKKYNISVQILKDQLHSEVIDLGENTAKLLSMISMVT